MRWPGGQTYPWLVLLDGLPRTRTARPFCTKIWIAHHWVHPWQAVDTHSPLAGPAGLALRKAIALVAGWARGSPAIRKPPVATDALMKSRLVSFILKSPSPLSECKIHGQNHVKS